MYHTSHVAFHFSQQKVNMPYVSSALTECQMAHICQVVFVLMSSRVAYKYT